jgi:hypothetical protein
MSTLRRLRRERGSSFDPGPGIHPRHWSLGMSIRRVPWRRHRLLILHHKNLPIEEHWARTDSTRAAAKMSFEKRKNIFDSVLSALWRRFSSDPVFMKEWWWVAKFCHHKNYSVFDLVLLACSQKRWMMTNYWLRSRFWDYYDILCIGLFRNKAKRRFRRLSIFEFWRLFFSASCGSWKWTRLCCGLWAFSIFTHDWTLNT